MSWSEFWDAVRDPQSEKSKQYRENLSKKAREDREKAGGWSGIFKELGENIKNNANSWEEKTYPERVEWRKKLLEYVSNPAALNNLTDAELEACKIIARSELQRFKDAEEMVSSMTHQDGKSDGSETFPMLASGIISPNEIYILATLVERNRKLIALVEAKQVERKTHPQSQGKTGKQEDAQKREEDLYQKLTDLKSRLERLIKIETGSKPMNQWTDEERNKVKKWESSIEAEEDRIREELAKIWSNI
jgi:Protein of unknown function (DUF2408)